MCEKYQDKIIHIVLDTFPTLTGDVSEDHWNREIYSRNMIMNGLKNCENDDIIFISDLDEIPNKNVVIEIKEYLSKRSGARE